MLTEPEILRGEEAASSSHDDRRTPFGRAECRGSTG
jgi:hypothetical protein